MLNYEIDPAVLLPRVPAGTELDMWQGATLVSVVGFRFLDVRLRGIPVPFHRNFEEVNLRFYVRRKHEGHWRRAVVFVREIVPRWAIAWVARLQYNEPYLALPMRHEVHMESATSGAPGQVRYEWRHSGWNLLEATTVGRPAAIAQGSEEEFITEHYWGYTAQRDGGTAEYEVSHPRWCVWQVSATRFECNVERLYGPGFREALSGRPRSAFVADGSPVAVYPGVRLPRERLTRVLAS